MEVHLPPPCVQTLAFDVSSHGFIDRMQDGDRGGGQMWCFEERKPLLLGVCPEEQFLEEVPSRGQIGQQGTGRFVVGRDIFNHICMIDVVDHPPLVYGDCA